MTPRVRFNSYAPLILRGLSPLVIVSGEGTMGTVEPYTGARTIGAIRVRLQRESANGDRWARLAEACDPTVPIASIPAY
mgnify:CR=1 FL=1